MTLKQMGLYERLRTHNTVYWHWEPGELSDAQCRQQANAAQIYLSSVNGLAMSGEIINIDGNCNRVAAVFYGHEKVYLVAGINKKYRHCIVPVILPRRAMRSGLGPRPHAQQKEIAVMTAAVRSASAEGCQYYGKRP